MPSSSDRTVQAELMIPVPPRNNTDCPDIVVLSSAYSAVSRIRVAGTYTRGRGDNPVTAPFASDPELLTLHAVRLLGMGDDDEVAARFDLGLVVAGELLLDFQAVGWVTRVEFAGTGGWTLTDLGRTEGERRLAAELAVTLSRPTVEAAHRMFLPQNERLLRAATDWQLRPSRTDPLAANDHTDRDWDQGVLDRLSTLSEDLGAICAPIGDRLTRFQGYDERFAAALDRVRRGDLGWVNRPKVDSCHTVWMQVHEDLLATLRLAR